MPQPSTPLMTWDPTGAQSTDPTPGLQNSGWLPGPIPRQITNAVLRNLFQWVGWLRDLATSRPPMLWCGGGAWGPSKLDVQSGDIRAGIQVRLTAVRAMFYSIAEDVTFYRSWGPVMVSGQLTGVSLQFPYADPASEPIVVRFYAIDAAGQEAYFVADPVSQASQGGMIVLQPEDIPQLTGPIVFRMDVELANGSLGGLSVFEFGRIDLTWA